MQYGQKWLQPLWSQGEWINQVSWLFACSYTVPGKLKVTLGISMVKYGFDLLGPAALNLLSLLRINWWIELIFCMLEVFFLYKHMYTFLLTWQIYNNNKIKRNNTKDTAIKHVLVFPFLKNKESWILAKKTEKLFLKKINEQMKKK